MTEQTIELHVGNEHLEGIIIETNPDAKCDLVSLHGAGQSGKLRSAYLLKELAERLQCNALTFDFSGHGESTGTLETSSLEKRVQEAKAMMEKYVTESPIIIASSMGGYIALKMLESLTPKALILFCPALYSRNAYNIPFNDQFSGILRTPDSWKETDVLDALEKYTGKLLVYIGTEDKTIPPGVIDLIDSHAKNVQKKEIIRIPGASHSIHVFIANHIDIKIGVVEKILNFVDHDRHPKNN